MSKTERKTQTDFKACASAGKILNNYLGVVCRSRIDGTPAEVLYAAQADTLAQIRERLDGGMDYQFLHEYYAVVESVPPEVIKELLGRAICPESDAKPSIFNGMALPSTCPFEESKGTVKIAKQRCWGCRIINDAARDMRRGVRQAFREMEATIDSRKPQPANRTETPPKPETRPD